MDSPSSVLRRAAVASWALGGIGVAGVAVASTLAYADTLKPEAEPSSDVAVQTAADTGAVPTPVVEVPVAIPTPIEPPPPPPVPEPPPVTSAPRVTNSVPAQSAQGDTPPEARKPPAPAAPTKAAPRPTTTRRINTPTTVQSPKYSPPHITVSRGS